MVHNYTAHKKAISLATIHINFVCFKNYSLLLLFCQVHGENQLCLKEMIESDRTVQSDNTVQSRVISPCLRDSKVKDSLYKPMGPRGF
jgi:hypothetical protein